MDSIIVGACAGLLPGFMLVLAVREFRLLFGTPLPGALPKKYLCLTAPLTLLLGMASISGTMRYVDDRGHTAVWVVAALCGLLAIVDWNGVAVRTSRE